MARPAANSAAEKKLNLFKQILRMCDSNQAGEAEAAFKKAYAIRAEAGITFGEMVDGINNSADAAALQKLEDLLKQYKAANAQMKAVEDILLKENKKLTALLSRAQRPSLAHSVKALFGPSGSRGSFYRTFLANVLLIAGLIIGVVGGIIGTIGLIKEISPDTSPLPKDLAQEAAPTVPLPVVHGTPVCFADYSLTKGVMTVGSGDQSFALAFSKAVGGLVYLHKDEAVAARLASIGKQIPGVGILYDGGYGSFPSVTVTQDETVLMQNAHGYFLQARIESVKTDSAADPGNKVCFSYQINQDKSDRFNVLSGPARAEAMAPRPTNWHRLR